MKSPNLLVFTLASGARPPGALAITANRNLSFQSVSKPVIRKLGSFPLRTSGHHPRAQVPPATDEGSGKRGHTEGGASVGFPQLSIYMGV